MKLIFLAILLTSCGAIKDVKASLDDLTAVRIAQALRISDAEPLLDEKGRMKNILTDCDGYLWQGKWCAVTGCDMSDYEVDGRLYRRPEPRCWDGKDQGSKTTWSKDMAACGLIPYALLQNQSDLINRHIRFGSYNGWVMGEPTETIDALSRVVYTLTLVNRLKGVRGFLDEGKSYKNKLPAQPGLKDYPAHLQTCGLWADIHMGGGYTDQEAKVLKAHADRVPDSPFYSLMAAKVTGDYSDIIDKCKSKDVYQGDYIRCNGHQDCAIIEEAFACELLIRGNDG